MSDLYVDGKVGIGTVSPTQKLDVEGGVEIGNTTNGTAGTIRWSGIDFEGYTGSQWVSLTASGGGAGCPPGQDSVQIGNASVCLADGATASATCQADGKFGEKLIASFNARYLNGVIQTRALGTPHGQCDSGWANGFSASCYSVNTSQGIPLTASTQTSVNGVNGGASAGLIDDGAHPYTISCSSSGSWN